MADIHPVGKATYDAVRHDVPVRPWTILAQDPLALGPSGRALTTTVNVPAERLERGPKGHRVHVVDYDSSTDILYQPRRTELTSDPYAKVTDLEELVRDPHFHQQNVYAITMATLCTFENALGRPVAWGFQDPSHQLKVAPHAFAEANAYYSRQSESLNFGYFLDPRGKRIYTCLSHDIVVHEATHALLDGLRPMYIRPSSPDQGGFHEGFSDIVALLSVFRSKEVIERLVAPLAGRRNAVELKDLDFNDLAATGLFKLAEEMGRAADGMPAEALRHSVKIRPNVTHYGSARFEEEHDCGELLVAIVLRSFIHMWLSRLRTLRQAGMTTISKPMLAYEGARAAKHLLKILIRAIDYLPPVNLLYPDYLSAILTADLQLYPDEDGLVYRDILRKSFEAFGVTPASRDRYDGVWDPPKAAEFTLVGTHFERMQRDPTEVFRFIWENKKALGIEPNAFTRVLSVRPVMRVSNDGAVLRETVVEYVQQLNVFGSELKSLGIRCPSGVPSNRMISLFGGGTLIFNEYGLLKFHIGTGVTSEKQSDRLQSLSDRGFFAQNSVRRLGMAGLHLDRAIRPARQPAQEW